jgi:hypothetical protein
MRLFNMFAIVVTLAATAALTSQKANADRVCRQQCVGPICEERCTETDGRGDRYEGRGDRERLGERRGHEQREERHDENREIELRIGR